jgi:hypothetical protein
VEIGNIDFRHFHGQLARAQLAALLSCTGSRFAVPGLWLLVKGLLGACLGDMSTCALTPA